MTREDFDNLSQDLLGRPVTAAEFQALLQAATALRLTPGSPVATLLILFQALRTEVAAATATRVGNAEALASRRRRGRIRGWITGAILGFCCGGLGWTFATLQTVVRDRQALNWALTEEGMRARRMSDSGLLKTLDDCSIPGWTMRGDVCAPGLDPATGSIRGIRTRSAQ
ncbi:hypothetical protein AB6806_18770 [Bosea sp. RCC_152_1]|uniref:hypothetical protein n=1 Tax=Bosea sp. RCC_152_1 TaxID=3239228 RepID=UPI003525F00E